MAHIATILLLLAATSNCFSSVSVDVDFSVQLMFDKHQAQDYNEGLEDKNELRRSRIKIKFKPFEHLKLRYSGEYDKDDKKLEVKDAWLDLSMDEKVSFYLGRKKQLGGLDQSLGLSEQFLLERSLANDVFGLGRMNLIGFAYSDKSLNLSFNLVEKVEEDEHRSEGAGIKLNYARGGKYRKCVFGLNANWNRGFVEEQKLGSEILAKALEGAEVKRPKEVLGDYSTAALEFAAQRRKTILQGEYFHRKEVLEDGENQNSSGFYWLLNTNIAGAQRAFSGGVFEPKKKRKMAAEISLRFSEVSLQGQDYRGYANIWTLGANLYPSMRSKLALQYEWGELKEVRDGNLSREEESALSFRFQYLL